MLILGIKELNRVIDSTILVAKRESGDSMAVTKSSPIDVTALPVSRLAWYCTQPEKNFDICLKRSDFRFYI